MPVEHLLDQAIESFRECHEADPGSIEEAEHAEQFNVLVAEYLAANEHQGSGLGAVARAISEAMDLSYRDAYRQIQLVLSYGSESADTDLDGVEDDYESAYEGDAYGFDDYDDDGEPVSRRGNRDEEDEYD